jgi:hypothetical protein
MCRVQLGKLPARIGELTAEGAAVLAISRDTRRFGENFGMILRALRQAKSDG